MEALSCCCCCCRRRRRRPLRCLLRRQGTLSGPCRPATYCRKHSLLSLPPPPPFPPSRYDGTVRNACGEVMQFLYGEDGMEGTSIESQRMDFLKFNRRKFAEVGGDGGWAGTVTGAGPPCGRPLACRNSKQAPIRTRRTPPYCLPPLLKPHLYCLQVYRYELDRPGWAPDWLDPAVLDVLRTDSEARAMLEGEILVSAGGCSCRQQRFVERVWCVHRGPLRVACTPA